MSDGELLNAARKVGFEVPAAADLAAPAGEQLIRWANRPGQASAHHSDDADDVRRRHQRRVDLRFEIAPRKPVDIDGGGID